MLAAFCPQLLSSVIGPRPRPQALRPSVIMAEEFADLILRCPRCRRVWRVWTDKSNEDEMWDSFDDIQRGIASKFHRERDCLIGPRRLLFSPAVLIQGADSPRAFSVSCRNCGHYSCLNASCGHLCKFKPYAFARGSIDRLNLNATITD